MLILAGVSLNALVGDNGIITNAQNASIKTSIATLEEFLHEKYIAQFSDSEIDGGVYSKIDLLRTKYPNYFYKPDVGANYVLINGNVYFLIKKSGLPEDLQKSIKGGDAGDKTYQSYASFKDVYGVTSQLEVYYCSDGLESSIGAQDG